MTTVSGIASQSIGLRDNASSEDFYPVPANRLPDEVVFRTADARKLRSFLTAHDVTVGPLEKYDNISLSFETHDPEGHRVGFRQQVGIPSTTRSGIKVSYGRIIHAGFVVNDRAAQTISTKTF